MCSFVVRVCCVLSADAVKAYKRSRQPNQSQNAATPAVNNTDSSSDRIVKSVVRIYPPTHAHY